MKIGIAKERRPHEARVAASPDTVKKFVSMGLEVAIESGAGLTAAYTDAAYETAGAKIVKTAKDALGGADIVREMFQSGELQTHFQQAGLEVKQSA